MPRNKGIQWTPKPEHKGKVLFAAQLHLCVAMLKPVLVRKAFWVDWCLRLAVLSLILMLIPLCVAMGISKNTEEPKPMRVIIEQPAQPSIPTAAP